MKLLYTTAAAALLTAGVAYAEDNTADAAAHGGAGVNAAAHSEITEEGGLTVGAHAFSDLDADTSGGLSLEEAQAFDPSVTQTAFGEFDANADGSLDSDEYSSWAADIDADVTGQGDVSLESDAPLDRGADVGVDADAGAGLGADVDATVDGVLE